MFREFTPMEKVVLDLARRMGLLSKDLQDGDVNATLLMHKNSRLYSLMTEIVLSLVELGILERQGETLRWARHPAEQRKSSFSGENFIG